MFLASICATSRANTLELLHDLFRLIKICLHASLTTALIAYLVSSECQ